MINKMLPIMHVLSISYVSRIITSTNVYKETFVQGKMKIRCCPLFSHSMTFTLAKPVPSSPIVETLTRK